MSKTKNYEAENELIVVTREQKELLENLLDNLGISVKDFLEIRSIKKYKRQTNKKISELEEEIKALKLQQKEFLKNLIQLNNRLSVLETNKTNAQVFSNLNSLLEGDEEDGSGNNE